MENRYSYNNCDTELAAKFIDRLAAIGYTIKSRKPATKEVLQERYTLGKDGDRVSIVLETKAETLVLTARPEHIEEMKECYGAVKRENAARTLPAVRYSGALMAGSGHNSDSAKTSEPRGGCQTKEGVNGNITSPPKVPKSHDAAASRKGACIVSDNADAKRFQGEAMVDKPLTNEESASVERSAKEVSIVGGGSSGTACKPRPKKIDGHETEKKDNAKRTALNSTSVMVGGGKDASDGNATLSTGGSLSEKSRRTQTDGVKGAQNGDRSVGNSAAKKTTSTNGPAAKTLPSNGGIRPAAGTRPDGETRREENGAVKKVNAESEEPIFKNNFSIKKFTSERLKQVLKRIKKSRLMNYKLTLSDDETIFYTVTDKKSQKVFLRYQPDKQSLQLQGKRSELFSELQLLIADDGDFKTVVSSHILLTGEEKRAGELQKLLKKRLPDAYGFLSEQSKIDITIGLIDIFNEDVKLSDYSMLLVPPYRGLERFIYDLQKAQGIEVKLIGQAFDKKDGAYTLKAGYRRKIRSVIYNEVMSALYTEYFNKRNFYAHSDNSADSLSRVITEKEQAKIIFEHLLELINYNGKKLKEIGFTVQA